ncbi:MAG: nitroreductase [Candidatus Eisenbacteria bacterium]|nr:nitroreductase [Candidatus Eisenbacteria bacterium]
MKDSAPQHLRKLVQGATRAPSSHNSQPWRFRISRDSIDLLADRSRALPINDPADRELHISCGCALLNLRCAAAREHPQTRSELLPDPERPDWLARVSGLTPGKDAREAGGAPSGEALARLFDQIPRRQTHRKPFDEQPPEPGFVERLRHAAEAEGCWLRPLQDRSARATLGDLVAAGDAAQWADPQWRRELAHWMRPRQQGEGLRVPTLLAPLIRFFLRSFDLGGMQGKQDRRLTESAPLLAVLGTERDGPREWLRAGQGLERLLLTASASGLQACYLNQPIQVEGLRRRLQDLAGDGLPQIVLRLGVPSGRIDSAPRRPVEDVIEEAG